MASIANLADDVLAQPVAIQFWVVYMIAVIFVVPGLLLRYKSSRREGKVILTG